MRRYRQALMLLAISTVPATAFAQDFPACELATAKVEEASAQIASNDFDGIGQTVYGAAYTRSTCLGDSLNRFRIEFTGAVVDERVGTAEAGLLGAGLELHPLAASPDLTLTPIARIGYEHFEGRGDRFIFGGAVTAQNVIWQDLRKRVIGGKTIDIARTQIILGGVVEYTDRRSAGASTGSFLILPDARATYGANFAIDQALPGEKMRMRATGGYQLLGRGMVNGYGYLEIGLRNVNAAQNIYRWNFTLRGSMGDGGYKGLLFGISRSFTSARKPGQ